MVHNEGQTIEGKKQKNEPDRPTHADTERVRKRSKESMRNEWKNTETNTKHCDADRQAQIDRQ